MYQEIILDHYQHPHHAGLRDPFDAEVHHVNPTCGDEVTLRVKLDGDGEPSSPTSPTTALGCSISQASASVLTDLVIGKHASPRRWRSHEEFLELMQSGARSSRDEDVLEDAVAFAGVVEVPGPGQVRAAGLDGLQGRDRPGLRAEHQRTTSTCSSTE